jgi:hypothetical protein
VKNLKNFYGPVLGNEQWRNCYNNKIYNLYKETKLTRNIRLRRLQCVGQVLRMKDEWASKKAMKELHRREKINWKAQRKMDKCSGQGC